MRRAAQVLTGFARGWKIYGTACALQQYIGAVESTASSHTFFLFQVFPKMKECTGHAARWPLCPPNSVPACFLLYVTPLCPAPFALQTLRAGRRSTWLSWSAFTAQQVGGCGVPSCGTRGLFGLLCRCVRRAQLFHCPSAP